MIRIIDGVQMAEVEQLEGASVLVQCLILLLLTAALAATTLLLRYFRPAFFAEVTDLTSFSILDIFLAHLLFSQLLNLCFHYF